jgi:hypothetical protein
MATAQQTSLEGVGGTRLAHLFDAELHYQPGMPVVVSAENREGELIGSGDGILKGATIQGSIRWSMFAADCAYLLIQAGVANPEQDLCKTNPGGVIVTRDGAQIWFNAKGYGLRGADPTHPHMWRLTAALQFATEDERYQWLNRALGLWEGEFDEEAGRANYRAYVALNE